MTRPSDAAGESWCLVVPVKRLESAKSRLGGTAAERARFALAFAADTIAAAVGCNGVAMVLVVTDDPKARDVALELGAEVVADREDAGLNPALQWGAHMARTRLPGAAIGALSADLPALRSDELGIALRFAAQAGRSGRPAVVADSHDRGTTAYLSAGGVQFCPAFGADSLAVHRRAGALVVPSADIVSVRRDVDTVEDLAAAVRLGVGMRTGAVLSEVEAG